MSKTNVVSLKTHLNAVTHEGAPAKKITPEQSLRRTLMACFLWEDNFYENGESVAERISNTVKLVDPVTVSNLAIEAREKMKLRHAPLLIAREMARIPTHKYMVAYLLNNIIQRADELTEFLALYWKDGKQPISKKVRVGLASAFTKFDAYQLAKYNRKAPITLRDVLFLTHPTPKNKKQAEVWKKLANNELESPDTWEVSLSAGKDKKETFERLLKENKLGALALLRNLRNMKEAGVSEDLIKEGLNKMDVSRVLPFRFITASKYYPKLENTIEDALFKSLNGKTKLSGKTVLLVDVSGSMVYHKLSKNSGVDRLYAACGIAIMAREICEDVEIFSFSEKCKSIPPRHGFALFDTIRTSQRNSSTMLGEAIKMINGTVNYDRLIVITDEQSSDAVPNPKGRGYMINIASYKNGVGYGKWVHIDGWSDTVLDYITQYEKEYS